MKRTAAVLSTLFAIALPALAQKVVTIPSTPTCARCQIELVKVAMLGGPNDSLRFPPGRSISAIQIDSHKRIFVGFHNGIIAVYDSAGHWSRTVGRVGNGPGEISDPISFFISPGDTLYVYTFPRLDIFGPNLKPLPSPGLPMMLTGELLPNGNFIGMTAGAPGLQVRTKANKVTATYGSADVGQITYHKELEAPNFTRGNGNTYWSYYTTIYRLAHWAADGTHLATLAREAPFFRAWTAADFDWHSAIPGRGRYRGYDTPELAKMGFVRQAPTGELWTFVLVQKATWKPIDTAAMRQRGEKMDPHHDDQIGKFHDTVIEIIDPAKGTLITSRRFPLRLLPTNRNDYAFTARMDDAGELYFDIWHVTVTREKQ